MKIEITGAGEQSFLPVPAQIPVCAHNPATTWSEALTSRLTIQSAPPYRLILRDGVVVFRYRLDNQVEERFFLLHLIANGWISARALARRWGISRNTIGDWSWRYRFFGLDGLADGRLPEREVLRELLSTAQATLRTSPGLSLTAFGRALEQAGYRDLPPATLRTLRATLAEAPTLPLAPRPDGPAVDTADGDDDAPSPEPPSEAAATAALPAAQPSADQAPSPAAQDEQPEREVAVDPEVPSAAPPEPAPAVPTPRAEQPDPALPLAPQPGGPAVDTADGDDDAPSPEPPSEAAATAALPAAQPSADQAPSSAAQGEQPERETALDPEVPPAAPPEPAPAVPTPRAEQPDPALDAAAVGAR